MNGPLVWLAEGIEVASENPVENLVLRGTREPYPFWNIVLTMNYIILALLYIFFHFQTW